MDRSEFLLDCLNCLVDRLSVGDVDLLVGDLHIVVGPDLV